MRLQVFNNKRGIIYGNDPKRICSDRDGTLKIGSTEIILSPEKSQVMPVLFHGATGAYNATFTDSAGNVYNLEKVTVQTGRIVAPSETKAEIMELHCLLDEANGKADRLQEKVCELEGIFDTDALNFLIK